MTSPGRREAYRANVGGVAIGADAPVAVQSMTNTDTADAASTAEQVRLLFEAGSELVRITVNNEAAAKAVPHIHEQLLAWNCPVPLVGDFHYNGHKLLTDFPAMAEVLAKYRINPGNVGFGDKQDAQFAAIIERALHYGKPVRIGANWGSLDQALLARMMDANAKTPQPKDGNAVMREALVASALESAQKAEMLGMPKERIILSCKVSRVQDLIAVYRDLAAKCRYPLHLGLTEAGMGSKGIVASTAALSVLLQEGIGDTIRVSLTPTPSKERPSGDRTEEVRVAQEILQALRLRNFTPQVTACPGCGRTTSTTFQELASDIQAYLRAQMPLWKARYKGVETMNVAVMGCIVNGPGESKHADIGISLPGSGESPAAPVFIDGQKAVTLRGDRIAEEFQGIVENYVERRYGGSSI